MMFSNLAAGAKAIGLRFTISGILPFAFLGWFAFGMVSVENAGPKESLIKALNISLHGLGTVGWGLMIVGSFVFAVITQPFQIAVVRLLEGYWGASVLSDHLRGICSELQRRRRHYLHARRTLAAKQGSMHVTAYLTRQLERYPAPDDMLPTLLGNTLRAGERSAGERYGLDTVRSWSRLYYQLPDTLQRDVADLHAEVDGGARVAIALGIAGIAGFPVLLPHGWWNLVWLSAMALSWVAYRGTIAAASSLKVVLASAFDLYRFNLLSALHLPLPDDLTQEIDRNKTLSEFLAFPEGKSPLSPGIKYYHPEYAQCSPSDHSGG